MINCSTNTVQLHVVPRLPLLSLRNATSSSPKFQEMPLELIMSIVEQALLGMTPKELATISKTVHSTLNRVIYRTVILSSPGSIYALHRTVTTSPHLLSQVKRLVVAVACDQGGTPFEAKISEIVAACHNVQALVLPALSSIPDLTSHQELKELVTPVFENATTLDRLLSRADTITHLRVTEPNEWGWLSPRDMLAKLGNPPNLTNLQLSRRAGANEQNDAVFVEEMASILSSFPRLRLFVVTVFKGYAWSSDFSAVEHSHIWKILLDLRQMDNRVAVIEGHRGEWKKEYEDFYPGDSIDSRFWARFDYE